MLRMTSKSGKVKMGGNKDKSDREKGRGGGGGGRDSRQGDSGDRPSVFSRLGTKMTPPGGGGGWSRGGPSPGKRKDGERYEDTMLDSEDQTTLEKKREMLQRELAKEMKDILK